jgi:DNA topoisomerase-3
LPTPTGIQLIDTIQNDLVKSAELTGSWEKQLKDIEKEPVVLVPLSII